MAAINVDRQSEWWHERLAVRYHRSMAVLGQSETLMRDRVALIRRAFVIEYLTIAWMVIEAGVAIGAAVEANWSI